MSRKMPASFEERIGDVVWAKMDNFPFWPSLVWDPQYCNSLVKPGAMKNIGKLHTVYFYGSGTFGFIEDRCIKDLHQYTAEQKEKKKKFPKGISEALVEAEAAFELEKSERLKFIRGSNSNIPNTDVGHDDSSAESESESEDNSSSDHKPLRPVKKSRSDSPVKEHSRLEKNDSARNLNLSKKNSKAVISSESEPSVSNESGAKTKKVKVTEPMPVPKKKSNAAAPKPKAKAKSNAGEKVVTRRKRIISSDSSESDTEKIQNKSKAVIVSADSNNTKELKSDNDTVTADSNKAKALKKIEGVFGEFYPIVDYKEDAKEIPSYSKEEIPKEKSSKLSKSKEPGQVSTASRKVPEIKYQDKKPVKKGYVSKAAKEREMKAAALEARNKKLEEMRKSSKPIYEQMREATLAQKKISEDKVETEVLLQDSVMTGSKSDLAIEKGPSAIKRKLDDVVETLPSKPETIAPTVRKPRPKSKVLLLLEERQKAALGETATTATAPPKSKKPASSTAVRKTGVASSLPVNEIQKKRPEPINAMAPPPESTPIGGRTSPSMTKEIKLGDKLPVENKKEPISDKPAEVVQSVTAQTASVPVIPEEPEPDQVDLSSDICRKRTYDAIKSVLMREPIHSYLEPPTKLRCYLQAEKIENCLYQNHLAGGGGDIGTEAGREYRRRARTAIFLSDDRTNRKVANRLRHKLNDRSLREEDFVTNDRVRMNWAASIVDGE